MDDKTFNLKLDEIAAANTQNIAEESDAALSEPKAKRGRPLGSKDTVPRNPMRTLPGEVANTTEFAMALANLPDVDPDIPEQVRNRIREYFSYCVQFDLRPTVSGICFALGIDRSTWANWGRGSRRGHSLEYRDIVRRTRGMMEALMETYAVNGFIDPRIAIFLLKNNFH